MEVYLEQMPQDEQIVLAEITWYGQGSRQKPCENASMNTR